MDGDDSMESLFDGMVLFDPISSSELPVDNNINHKPDVNNDTIEVPQSNEPLDENLFSDLTLIIHQNDDVSSSSSLLADPNSNQPVSPSSSSTSSRSTIDVVATSSPSQTINRSVSSTRKKKKGGLRIGYGRTPHSHDDSQASSPVVFVNEEKRQNEILLDARITTESEIVSDNRISTESDLVEKGKDETVSDNRISTQSSVVEKRENDVVSVSSDSNVAEVEEEQIKLDEVVANSEVQSKEDLNHSIELTYEQIKKRIDHKLKLAREEVALVSVTRREFIKKRRKAVDELGVVSDKYKEMEKELEEAVETEDFERAERVSDGLASAERDRERLLVVVREVEAECDAVEVKMQEALEMQTVAEEECAGLLERFAVDADHDADAVISNAETKSSEEMEKWFSLSEALEVKKMEAEIESHVLAGARQVVDESIEDVVKDDKEESELLHKKKGVLAEELQELLALVEQKEAEIAENDSKIKKVEKRMADAVSTFQEAQSNIRSKSDTLQSGLSELESENDSLTNKKKEIDDFLLQEEARGSKIRELGRISADEAGMYKEVMQMRKSLIEFISKSREDKRRLANSEQKLFDDVQMLRQDISAVRASLQDLSSTKSGTQQEIESSKQRLLFIEKRVPEIESEKRVAATARNFKEAARIANEAKALYAEKEILQIKIDEAMAELKKIEDGINQNVDKLQEKEENMSAMEKELETVRYQRLILIAGAATAERSAALQLGDHEEADILLKEAQAADSEARKIQPTSNEDEFVSLPKSFISMELVSTLDKKQLAELVASTQITAP
ncbi:UVR domain-containing protein [Tanacetum coccineum]